MSRPIDLSDLEVFPDHTPGQAAAAHALIDARARAEQWPLAQAFTIKAALGLIGGSK